MRAGFRLLRTQALRARKQAILDFDGFAPPVTRRLRDQMNKAMRNA